MILKSLSEITIFDGSYQIVKSRQHLDLSWNRLIGGVPPKFGELVQLEQLLIYHNKLTGTLPPKLGNLKYFLGANLL